MKIFADEKQGDLVEFNLRVRETQREVMQAMFISAEETKTAMKLALQRALSDVDIVALMKADASKAITDAVHSYFTYGEGRDILQDAVNQILSSVIPNLFGKKK